MHTPEQVKKLLKFHLTGKNLQKVPALVGLTGVGKTAITKQVAKELGMELVYFNVAQLSDGELALPVATGGTDAVEVASNMVHYNLNYKLREVYNHPDRKYLIFFDEFTRGTVSVISELMTFLNEREYQGYKLHDNVRFIAAMNPTTTMKGYADEEYASTEFDDAHANRFTFIDQRHDVTDWLEWGSKDDNIHPFVLQFLRDPMNAQYFYGKETDGIRMRTPRAWDYLSQDFKQFDAEDLWGEDDLVYSVISDQVGSDVGTTLFDFIKDMLATIDPEQILSGKILAKDVKQFQSFDEVKKVQTLVKAIDFLGQNQSRVTEKSIQNFTKLWDLLESKDNKFNLIYTNFIGDWQTKYGLTESLPVLNMLLDEKKNTVLTSFYREVLRSNTPDNEWIEVK